MTKARYSNEVTIKNGRIRRSVPIGLESATEEQRVAIDLVKPVMNAWLRSKIESGQLYPDSDVQINAKYIETSNGLTVEFKVQSVVPVG